MVSLALSDELQMLSSSWLVMPLPRKMQAPVNTCGGVTSGCRVMEGEGTLCRWGRILIATCRIAPLSAPWRQPETCRKEFRDGKCSAEMSLQIRTDYNLIMFSFVQTKAFLD